MKKPFVALVTYFKDTGKLYTSCEFTAEFSTLCQDPTAVYMNDVIDAVKRWRDEGKLPGLQSGRWDGPILVDCQTGFQRLLLPGR